MPNMKLILVAEVRLMALRMASRMLNVIADLSSRSQRANPSGSSIVRTGCTRIWLAESRRAMEQEQQALCFWWADSLESHGAHDNH